MAAEKQRKADSGAGVRQNLRLASGLVLVTFAFPHFLNHMLGIWSLGAMEAGRLVFLAVWRSAPGEALLLKVFDSRYPEGILGTPHTAADPVNTPDNARNRNSLEVRVIAFS